MMKNCGNSNGLPLPSEFAAQSHITWQIWSCKKTTQQQIHCKKSQKKQGIDDWLNDQFANGHLIIRSFGPYGTHITDKYPDSSFVDNASVVYRNLTCELSVM